MQLSIETLQVIKNFAAINQGIEFKQGTKIRTMSAGKTILAEANVKDEFPADFCVYDLNQFLSVYSLFKEGSPELDVDTANILFRLGNKKTKYRKTSRETIVTASEKNISLPSVDCSFELSAENYEWIMRSANVLSSPNVAVESNGEVLTVVAMNANDDSAHTNSLEIAPSVDGKTYKIVFKTENIKMLSGAYDVDISFKGVSHFKHKTLDLQYWIAFEAKESKVD